MICTDLAKNVLPCFLFAESWLRLFSVIMDLMRRGYPDVELTLTCDEKLTIRTTWDAVQKEVEQVRLPM